MSIQGLFDKYLKRNCVLFDLHYDEKQVRRIMDDRNLRLRWHERDKMVCVLYKDSDKTRTIFSLSPAQYCLTAVVAKLRQREEARNVLIETIFNERKRMEDDQTKKRKEVASTMANGIEDLTKHRVLVTVP
jgi:hypothetical protein